MAKKGGNVILSLGWSQDLHRLNTLFWYSNGRWIMCVMNVEIHCGPWNGAASCGGCLDEV